MMKGQTKQEIATCVKAEFLFTTDTGLALFLEFNIDGTNQGITKYISDYMLIMKITEPLRQIETGYSKCMVDQEDIEELVGKKAMFITANENTMFAGFISDKK